MSSSPSQTPTPRRRPTSRQATAAAAVVAAVAGVATAGTFAGAAGSGSSSAAKTTSTAKKPLTAAQKKAAAARKKAAAKKTTTTPKVVRVVVKRGLKGSAGPIGRTGADGPQGPAGTPGPQGAPASDAARSLSLNWIRDFTGKDTAGIDVAGIGRLDLTCNTTTRELRLTPARSDVRTIMTADVYSATNGDHRRIASAAGEAVTAALPVSGLLTAVLSVEPKAGDGGATTAPATVMLSIESKTNAVPADNADPTKQDFNYCYAAAQTLQAAG
ncbi:hypothetical protein DSM112329_05122 [Paraconexibacter sp. AEG42_29]|uniref:Collagen-like protein n=1 Tax=Paraconexibacter sp. AEG42_29 TaxID=2997339 RepID=A0AAU7B3U9_9ACTN